MRGLQIWWEVWITGQESRARHQEPEQGLWSRNRLDSKPFELFSGWWVTSAWPHSLGSGWALAKSILPAETKSQPTPQQCWAEGELWPSPLISVVEPATQSPKGIRVQLERGFYYRHQKKPNQNQSTHYSSNKHANKHNIPHGEMKE